MYQSDRKLSQQLDRNRYNDQDLLQIKIPLNMPYYTSQPDFERIDGEVHYKGMYYNYVKRKVSRDTLYILCLPNEQKTRLHSAQLDYVKSANDLPAEKDHAGSKKAKLLSEYDFPAAYACATISISHQHMPFYAARLHPSFANSNFHPPERQA